MVEEDGDGRGVEGKISGDGRVDEKDTSEVGVEAEEDLKEESD